MSIVLPSDARGPILDLALPASVPAVDLLLRNKTTAKSLTIAVPAAWPGTDLRLDFFRRTIRDAAGLDRSALLSPTDNALWTLNPLIAGANDVAIEAVAHPSNISDLVAAGEKPVVQGIAVDGTYLYFAQATGGAIGRIKLDGTGLNKNFISTAGIGVTNLACNATHIYWTNENETTIGRAKIDGTEVNKAFIASGTGVKGIALDATYVYWNSNVKAEIGRSKLDGTEVNKAFIAGTGAFPYGLAIRGSYLYWTSTTELKIGRAKIDGTEVNKSLVSAIAEPYGIATDANYVYWADNNFNKPQIGRAKLDGTGVNVTFASTGGSSIRGLAVNAESIFWADLTAKTIKKALLNYAMSYKAVAALHWEKGYY